MNADFVDEAVSRIHDCAIEPDRWEAGLEQIGERRDMELPAIHFVSFAQEGAGKVDERQ
ncbi:MAG: hypothetical protein ACK4F5_14285 [Aliihoeflea sp.]